MTHALFITGTGTDVGKTFVAGLFVKRLVQEGKNPGYYKAAMSGNLRQKDGQLIPGDALHVQQTSGISQSLESMCPFVYEQAWSPHLAARSEQRPVDWRVIDRGFKAVCSDHDFVVVEGSGGVVCPLRLDHQSLWQEDVIRNLGLASLIVSPSGLGAINQVVLTAEFMKARNYPVKGLVFNCFHPGDPIDEDNILVCQQRTGLPIVACVKEGDRDLDMASDVLYELFS